MQTLKSVVTGFCSMALVLMPVAAPLAGAVAAEPWEILPEDSLRDLRGGMDMGDLVASFAIERVVQIDGVVVARMQLVISNLDRLAKGGMPTISVTGPMAQIVQFMKTAGNVSVAGNNASIPASVPSLPAAPPAAAAAASAASAGPTVASSGNSGTVSATGTQSGSMAQMGSALTHAVTAASNATTQPSASGASATASPSTASSLASTASSAAPTASAQRVSTGAASTNMTIPVGTTGQAVVLSNLPNAAALTTAVQNEVHAATIQTQTTISATVNSMPALNAISLSNSIRAAVSGGG